MISFPARLQNVLCIGSADGKGSRSSFSPPFIGEEKYSVLGEAVSGAWPLGSEPDIEPGREGRLKRLSGTSTAVTIAAGITACLIDFTRQFLDRGRGADDWINLRKIFLKMSEPSSEEPYRYLAPKYFFTCSEDMKEFTKSILRKPFGMTSHSKPH
jgi:hypothetical protein